MGSQGSSDLLAMGSQGSSYPLAIGSQLPGVLVSLVGIQHDPMGSHDGHLVCLVKDLYDFVNHPFVRPLKML